MKYWQFSQLIINWYHMYGRKNLPWQIKKTDYHIWISEIMLQQTQVKTVIPYYKKFISTFNTIDKLAQTNLDEILHIWSGLGYYKRAINLHKTAKIIINKYHGYFPNSIIDLIKLPGIGKTTAGAILSLSKNFSFPILDGNVKRILTRFYNLPKNFNKLKHYENKLWHLINMITPIHNANKFNQGMMDLGSLICQYKKPKCHICPLNQNCQYIKNFNNQKTNITKIIKKKIFFYLIIQYKNFVYLERRKNKKIWENLFCFPEFNNIKDINTWLIQNEIKNKNNEKINSIYHQLSHIKLKMKMFKIIIKNKKIFSKNNHYIWYNLYNPPHIGISQPIKKILIYLKKIDQD
ncbi:A/G-specific adenine glycosylase [Buchnera aphidicola]|uniref:Adenine DNA glycosylase n=1 Tax=Buchnera aphidicola (Stegophylla sp.) TaxID=2315800 RepID=A0A4D6Y947_9GAMM|nr:A/G-specific adenine glycosylase [Buchnera aphidicola (Stegophylla sp.)]QCI26506.1 A/G-specific adenine glycosylase [Buchnera aphidicola (Stegophylla sp.)]